MNELANLISHPYVLIGCLVFFIISNIYSIFSTRKSNATLIINTIMIGYILIVLILKR